MAHNADPQNQQEITTQGGVDAPAIALVGTVSVLLLIVIVIASQAWYYDLRDANIARTQYTKPNAEVETYLAEQHEKLNTARWVGEEETTAAIPIDRAMEIYAERGIQSGTP